MYRIVLLLLMLPTLIHAQNISVGSWRTHLTYHNAQNIAIGENKAYCASVNGLFILDLADNSLEALTTINGLSDIGVADLAYSQRQNTLVIAYQNGNIDLLREDEIINIRTLLNSGRSNVGINAITLVGDLAIFATDFGGVELNLNTLTLQDAYENIGGTASQGTDIAATTDSLFLATNNGVYAVSLSNTVNKQDFRNWNLVTSATNLSHLETFNDKLHWAINGDAVYQYENGTTTALSAGAGLVYNGLTATASDLYLSVPNQLIAVKADGTFTSLTGNKTVAPQEVALLGSQLWVADEQTGLVKFDGASSENFFPTGTFSPESFRVFHFQDKILAVAGGYSSSLTANSIKASFYVFDNGQWTNYTATTNFIDAITIPDADDLTGFAYDAQNQIVYLGAFSGSVIKFDLATNTFESIVGAPANITSLTIDSDGKLFASSSFGGVFEWVTSGSWQRITTASAPVELLIDREGNRWARQNSNSVLVFDVNGQQRLIGHGSGAGNLRGNQATSIAVDQEGSVWVGTNDGITEFFDPFGIFSGVEGAVVRDIDGNVILKDAVVTAITIDGGNRKWLGTRNNGVFLYSAEGELLESFTIDNSPLLSNEINGIAIQPETGEIFFATSQGIISYRGTATEGKSAHDAVAIFPNPVRPNFTGLVTISGLVTNATIRITDVAGKVVYKTQAAGGTATWNAANFDGTRVQTGVYMIFSADESGEETFVGKVAVIQ